MHNVTEAHNRVKDFDWDFSYVNKTNRYPTKYKIPAKTKDPFRTLIRDYCAMEQEKDDRQYGALQDALARIKTPAQASDRWAEILKVALPVLVWAEYAALKATGQLVDAVDNPELRMGYLAQMLDEQRHVSQETYLIRYFAKYAKDPEAFARSMKLRGTNLFYHAGRSALETFFQGDPVAGAISLQVVAETGYTNNLFVATTEIAATNGDQATPSVFLSVQSDETRHMANGYATLAAVLSEPENLKYLQDDFDEAFWRNHNFLDPFLGTVYDYYQKERTFSYLEKWNEWTKRDWGETYISKLEPFGLKAPKWFPDAVERVKWVGHTTALFSYASWPLQFWRMDPQGPADMDWFEKKYPGWHNHFGQFHEDFARMSDPAEGTVPMTQFKTLPPLCRVCQMLCIYPRMDNAHLAIKSYHGKAHAFCSSACEELFAVNPERYLGYETWYEKYDGYDLAEYIVKNDLLRYDGKTLLAQPSLNENRMWTIDDIRRLHYEIKDPLRGVEATEVVA